MSEKLQTYALLTDERLLGSDADRASAQQLADAAALDGDVTVYVVKVTEGTVHKPRRFERADDVQGPAEVAARAKAKAFVARLKVPVPEDVGAREIRETVLHEMSAAEVRAIAVAAGVEQNTKADNIDAILDAEFPA